jgi:hypothetical protein
MAAEMGRRITLAAGSVALIVDPEAFILAGTAAHPVLVASVRKVADAFAAQLPMRFLVSEFGPEAPLVGAIGEATSALRAAVFTSIVPDRSGR